MLGALFMDYRYTEADQLVDGPLQEESSLPKQVYYNIADFFIKTRCYEKAEYMLACARAQSRNNAYFLSQFVRPVIHLNGQGS